MSSQRSVSIDLIKLVAAFGVVIIHLAPSTEEAEAFSSLFSLFSVPFFLLISLYFFINKFNAVSPPRLSELRLDRILVPYAVWSAIYTIMRVIKFRLRSEPFEIDVIGFTLFGQGALQLYFIPLLLLFQVQSLAMIFLLRVPRQKLIGVSAGLASILFGYFGSSWGYLGFDSSLQKGVAYVVLAFLLGHMQTQEIGRQVNVVVGWLMLACIAWTVFFGYPLNWTVLSF